MRSSHNTKGSFFELVEEYIEKRQLAESHARVYRVLSRAIARYQGFVKATDIDRSNYEFDIDKVTKEDIEDLTYYLRNDKKLSDEYPELFKKLINEYPAAIKKGHNYLEERGDNTIIKMRTRLKSLFLFFYEEGLTTNRPFDGVKIGTAKVGTPKRECLRDNVPKVRISEGKPNFAPFIWSCPRNLRPLQPTRT